MKRKIFYILIALMCILPSVGMAKSSTAAPKILKVDTIKDSTVKVTGKSDSQTKILVKNKNKTLGSSITNSKGSFSVKIKAQKVNTSLDVYSINQKSKKQKHIKVKVQPTKVSKITVSPSKITINAGSKTKLKATVSPSNATYRKITWSVKNGNVAKVDKQGNVIGVSPGTTTLYAKADGKSASVSVKVQKVSVTSIKLPSSIALPIGSTKKISAAVSPSNATYKSVTWSSVDKNIATVDKNGLIKAVKVGTTKITAKADGKTAVSVVKVEKIPVSKVTVQENVKLIVGESKTLTASVTPSNATYKTINWSSSNSSIVAVDKSGKITAIKEGTAKITAIADGVTATTTVTVGKIPVTAVSLPSSLSIKAGANQQLSAAITPDNATYKKINWSSSNSAIVKVDSEGNISGLAEGTADITATVDGISVICKVTVEKVPVTKIEIPATITIKVGSQEGLNPEIYPENATYKSVSWVSSDTSVVKVDKEGIITGLAEGISEVTATADGMTAKTTVTVEKVPVESIHLNQNVTMKSGATTALTYSVVPENATYKQITWTSSDESIAKVDNNGNVTGIAEGTATITAAADGVTATSTITVSNRPQLNLRSYPSVLINNVIHSLAIQATNYDTVPVTVEKVEIYESGSLFTTYTASKLTEANIPTVINQRSNWGFSLSFRFGMWLDNSKVKLTVRTDDGKSYEYETPIQR
ncbi:Ig-like domain-containing protein [Mesobacillus foraminis]|uniref:Ig-like domain-containing protein n=1 Tax=Mesobacillus foraminis TaxID=279826 RepID=UPI0039A3494B